MNRKQRRAKGGAATGGKDASALLRQARELVVKGALAEAHFIYGQILKDDPDNAGALLDLGVAALERRDTAAAAPLIEKAARLAPANPWALMALAVVKMEQRDGDAALALCEKAEKLDPPAEALTKLGLFYKETGYLDRAAACLRRAVDKKPELVMAWFNLRDLKKWQAGDPDLARLEAAATKTAALPPRQQAQM
jgi:tetratricopeptide (TPR) repeat protein